jgi:hypothetical protein
MALPLLNETPKYTMTIPSTGQTVRFRPYLVKEEKVLLLASESNDINQVMNAVFDTIAACVAEPIDRKKLTTFDLEYMFIKIRSKSVGENVELNLACDACSETNKAQVNLEEIDCNVTTEKTVIKLSEEVSVEMKYPSYDSIDLNGDETELGFEILANCLDAVLTEEERIDIADEPKESVRAFLESMSKEQFDLLADFMNDLPQIKTHVDYTCHKCGHENSVKVAGMQSFF